MATVFKTPGVYVVEKSLFPPSVAQVETAIPAFIGYTEKAMENKAGDLQLVTKKITSLLEFERYFGYGPPTTVSSVTLNDANEVIETIFNQTHYLYDSLKLFFSNGGGKCYIISVGYYTDGIDLGDFETGLGILKKKDEPTLIVFPDAVSLSSSSSFYALQKSALAQCSLLMDRFAVLDTINYLNPNIADDTTNFDRSNEEFRNNIGMSDLKYGAAYIPWVKAIILKDFTYANIFDKLKKNAASIDFQTNLIPLLPDNDQIIINGIIDKYEDYIETEENVANAYQVQYGNSNYNLKQVYSDLLSVFKSNVTNSLATMDNVRSSYQALHEESLMLIDFIDDLLNSITLIITDTVLYAECQEIATGVADELLKLVILNNTIGALDLIGTTTGYPRHLVNFRTQYESDPGNWENVELSTSLSDTTTNELLFQYSVAAIAAAPASERDSMRRSNMMYTENIITDSFYAFYNSLNSIYDKIASLMETKENELISSYPLYKNIINSVNNSPTLMPPSGAIVGRYAYVDSTRGVWKAPANVSLNYVQDVGYHVADSEQDTLNVDDESGKSLNVIRTFTGKGVLIWGARTLAGNDNEWRYVSVRRFFNMVEESVKKSTSWAVFEPNDANTWNKVKGMIDNFLILQWRNGALQGAKPEEAFYVKVGLGQTMTSIDILEGRMNVEIGMAVVRPAEFIILTFMHKMVTSS